MQQTDNRTIAMQNQAVVFHQFDIFTIETHGDFQQVVARMLIEQEQGSNEYVAIIHLLHALLAPDKVLEDAYKLACGPTPNCECSICDSHHMRENGYVCEDRPEIFTWFIEAAERFVNPFWHISAAETSWMIANRWAHAWSSQQPVLGQILAKVYGSQYKPIHNGRDEAERIMRLSKDCGCADCERDIKECQWYLKLTEGALSRDPEFA